MSVDHTVYTVHPPLRRQDYTISLEDDSVLMTSEKGKQKRIHYCDILEINVSYIRDGMYRCLIKNKVDDRIGFTSHTAEDKDRKSQLEDFCAFVMELHSRTAQYQDKILYTQGLPFMFYVMTSIVTILALVVVSVFPLMIIIGKKLTANLNMSLIITLTVIVCVGSIAVLKVKPKRYNPGKGIFPYDIATIADLIKQKEISSESAEKGSALE